MLLRRIGVLAAALAALSVPVASASAAPTARSAKPPAPAPALTIGGTVADPASYTLSQLAALPTETTTVPDGRSKVTVTGVSLDLLVTDAAPVLPDDKNALLRVIVTADGSASPSGHGWTIGSTAGNSIAGKGPVSFALGELDPNFGDHDALVVLSENGKALRGGPALVVPGDKTPIRDLPTLRHIQVGVTNPAVTAPPSPGALVIEDGAHQVVLPAKLLARLPEETKTVTFGGPDGEETHTETGPTLDSVLRAAHIRENLNTWVAAVGSDGYVATVTPAEAWTGGRPLLISLIEDGVALSAPRLVTDGDIAGGRYDSGVYDLVIGQGAPAN